MPVKRQVTQFRGDLQHHFVDENHGQERYERHEGEEKRGLGVSSERKQSVDMLN